MRSSVAVNDLAVGVGEEGKDLFSRNGGKAFQKTVEGVAGLQVLDEGLHRDPGPGKDGSPAHDFGRDGYYTAGHG